MITRICHGYLEPMLELVNPGSPQDTVWGVRWETIDCEGFFFCKTFPIPKYDSDLINRVEREDCFNEFKFTNSKIRFKLRKVDVGYRAILFGNFIKKSRICG